MKNGIIFDMDGTLWDSAEGVAKAWTKVIQREHDKDMIVTEQDVKSVMGKTMDVIADLIFPNLDKTYRTELLDRCCEYENEYLQEHGAVLYPKLEETLQKLMQDHDLYIVSNCQCGYIEAFLNHYGFGKYFKDIECYGNNLKSKGDNIRLIVERNRIQNPYYVGDIQGDYEASAQAGVGFIHAAYGFGTIAVDVPRIEAFEQLPEVLRKLHI